MFKVKQVAKLILLIPFCLWAVSAPSRHLTFGLPTSKDALFRMQSLR